MVDMGPSRQRRPEWVRESDVSPYANELITINWIGINSLQEQSVSSELPLITAKSRKVYPRVRLDKERIRSLLKASIDQLDDDLLREAAYREFGFLAEAGVATSHDRRASAAEILYISPERFRRGANYERRLIEEVAARLERLKAGDAADSDTFKRPHVPRTDLDAQVDIVYRQLIARGADAAERRIYFIGEAGFGKSHCVARLTSGEDRVWINAETVESMLTDIADTLDEYGVELGKTIVSYKHSFRKLLASVDSPPIVVFDGVDEPSSIDELIPLNSRALVIVTSRRMPQSASSYVIRVGSLTDDESQRLVSLLLPTSQISERRTLSAILGNHPLAITQVCAYLAETPQTTIQDFCRAASRDMAIAVEATAASIEHSLVQVYRSVIEQLYSTNPDSILLLAVFAFGVHVSVPARYLAAFLSGSIFQAAEDYTFSELRYRSAVRRLERACLVEASGSEVSMHKLTQGILRSLLEGEVIEIAELVQNFYRSENDATKVPTGWDYISAGWSASESSFAELNHFVLLLRIAEVAGPEVGVFREISQHRELLHGLTFDALIGAIWERIYPQHRLRFLFHHAEAVDPSNGAPITTAQVEYSSMDRLIEVLALIERMSGVDIHNNEEEFTDEEVKTNLISMGVFVSDEQYEEHRAAYRANYKYDLATARASGPILDTSEGEIDISNLLRAILNMSEARRPAD